MINLYKSRTFVSYQGKCPMNCKHCYAHELEYSSNSNCISEVVNEVDKQEFDIIYVSQRYENFYDEEKGVSLCQALYERHHKDLLIITRSYLSDRLVEKLVQLNKTMQCRGNQLYLAVSICAEQSYSFTEDESVCPTPQQRLLNLKRVHPHHIKTLLFLRPVFPDKVIPAAECISIIKQAKDFTDAVISSGLIVSDAILKRLGLEKASFAYLESGDSSYLADLNQDDILYMDVENELQMIQNECEFFGIPFFRHSMPALNYLLAAS